MKQIISKLKKVAQKVIAVTMYKSLNDAPMFSKKGNLQVWYQKGKYMRDLGMGLRFLKKYADDSKVTDIPTFKTLKNTHIQLGAINYSDMEKAWKDLQGENWSPEGEAYDLIKDKKLDHTSMSVGDTFVKGKDLYFVDNMGIEKL